MGCPVGGGPATAVTLVENGYSYWRGEAQQAFDEAVELVSNLSDLNLQPLPTSIEFNVDASFGQPFTKPDAPEDPNLQFSGIDGVGGIEIADIALPDYGVAPTATLDKPNINLPDTPAPFSGAEPGAAPAVTDVTVPEADELVIPAAPDLREIALPDVPTTSLPVFTASAPGDTPTAPAEVFSFLEEEYGSTTLTALDARIQEMLAGGTGLPENIWSEIWDKGRTQESRTATKAVQEATEEWASRGFSLPPGVLDERIREARQKVQDAENQLSREVSIQRAQMEVENLKFATAQALALESMLVQAHLEKQGRALQAAQYTVDAAINLFNAKVTLFNAELNAYSVEAEVYKSRIEAEALQLDMYRAELEGKRIIGELNRQDVEIYSARLDALNTQVSLYKSQVEAVQAVVDIDKTRVDAYRAEVQAYSERVGAKTAEFQAYGEQIKGEMAKVEMYGVDARALATRVEAYAAQTNAQTSQARLAIENEELKLKHYGSRLDKYKAEIGGEVARIQAATSVYDGRSRMYAAELGAENARVQADSRQFELALEEGRTEATLSLKQAELAISQVQRIAEIEAENSRTLAKIQASLASAAMSAVSLSAGVSSSASDTSGCTTSYSYSGKI